MICAKKIKFIFIYCLIFMLFFCIFFAFNFFQKNNFVVCAEDEIQNELYQDWFKNLRNQDERTLVLTDFDVSKKLAMVKAVKAFTGWGLKDSKEAVENLPVTFELNGHTDEEIETFLQALEDCDASYQNGDINLSSISFCIGNMPSDDGIQVGNNLFGFLNEDKTSLCIYAGDGGKIYAYKNLCPTKLQWAFCIKIQP